MKKTISSRGNQWGLAAELRPRLSPGLLHRLCGQQRGWLGLVSGLVLGLVPGLVPAAASTGSWLGGAAQEPGWELKGHGALPLGWNFQRSSRG